MGLQPKDVAQLISEVRRVHTRPYEANCSNYHVNVSPSRPGAQVFAEQIFVHGRVHCDPHAANMLIRRDPSGRGRAKPLLVS